MISHRTRCRSCRARPCPDGPDGPAAPRRVALLSMHTSPLSAPGSGDAGGMNVYVLHVAQRLAAAGVAVDVFTRATASDEPPAVHPVPGVTVRHVPAGPFEGIGPRDLPAQLCAFTAGVLRAGVGRGAGYDLVHSHYWLSGQAGRLVADRWGVPLVHTAHTLGKVKNVRLPAGDRPEPVARLVGEQEVVAAADRLVANTAGEADDLIEYYRADPARIRVVEPGVDLARFNPGDTTAGTAALRRRYGLPADAAILLFVGRIQPLKAPDLLLRATALLPERIAGRPVVPVLVGGPSGTGLRQPGGLRRLAAGLGLADRAVFLPSQPADRLAELYRCADLLCVPSHYESFGLVALEAQACGTPVVAAAVGGLPQAVADGVTGALVDGHDPAAWADALAGLLTAPDRRAAMSAAAVSHARGFSWQRTAGRLLDVYRDALDPCDAPLTA